MKRTVNHRTAYQNMPQRTVRRQKQRVHTTTARPNTSAFSAAPAPCCGTASFFFFTRPTWKLYRTDFFYRRVPLASGQVCAWPSSDASALGGLSWCSSCRSCVARQGECVRWRSDSSSPGDWATNLGQGLWAERRGGKSEAHRGKSTEWSAAIEWSRPAGAQLR